MCAYYDRKSQSCRLCELKKQLDCRHLFFVCGSSFCWQVLFKDGVFQWKRLENLIVLAKENVAKMSSNPASLVKSRYCKL